MRIIRILGNFALWLGALLGVVAGGVWVAGQFGLVQPLIVISGSMEPGIHTGDMVLDTWTPTLWCLTAVQSSWTCSIWKALSTRCKDRASPSRWAH